MTFNYPYVPEVKTVSKERLEPIEIVLVIMSEAVTHQEAEVVPNNRQTAAIPKRNTDAHVNANANANANVKKCSRCRVKRVNESPHELAKYATCLNCRNKRKVKKAPVKIQVDNLYTDYNQFVEKIKTNIDEDIIDFRYRGETDPQHFKRYDVNSEVDTATYQQVSKQLVDVYLSPLMHCTGYRFPVRDYHKGGRRIKKIAFVFICSQDRGKQRKSRSSEQRYVANKLKVEDCESKIALNYSLHEGIVNLYYNHKAHSPYVWKKNKDGSDDEGQSLENDNHARTFDEANFAEQFQQFQQIQPRTLLTLQHQYQQQQAQAQALAHQQQQVQQAQAHNALQLPQIQQQFNNLAAANTQHLQTLAQFSTHNGSNKSPHGLSHFNQLNIPPSKSPYQQPQVGEPLNSRPSPVSSQTPPQLDFSLQAQQVEEAATAASSSEASKQYSSHYQKSAQHDDNISVENIDKDLIGLNNE